MPMSIYFVKVGRKVVKIGYSANAYRRSGQFQCLTYEPIQLLTFIDGDRVAERALHKRFDAFHLRGELFRFQGELRDYIESLPQPPPPPPPKPRKPRKYGRTISPEKAAEYGALGGAAKGKAASSKRMAKPKARQLWKSKDLTADQALELMDGWTRETAYRYLGRRNTPTGRRPTK